MYKILLVDDETRQLKALANIIQKLRPNYYITLADDGLIAFDELSKQDFDIMILDIKMPNLDGLELLEKLGNKREQLKTVIMSGFTEFSYAKKAISYGVHEYIVKPIKKSDIEGMLTSLENILSEEDHRIQKEVSLQKKLEKSLPVYLEHILNQWIKGICEEKGIQEISSLFPFRGHGAVLLTELKGIEAIPEAQKLSIRQDIKFRMKKVLNEVGHSVSFFSEENKEHMVTIINSEERFNLSAIANKRRLLDFVDSINVEFELVTTISLSTLTNNIFEHVIECFTQARLAMNKKFYMNRNTIIYYNNEEPLDVVNTWNTENLERVIYDALVHLDYNACYQITKKTALEDCPMMEPVALKEAVLLLMLNLSKILSNVLAAQDYYLLKENIKFEINNCENYDILWHKINRLLRKMIHELDVQKQDLNGVIIQKCKEFIDENYAEDFTLESIASNYHFSSAYFGNLFKEYTELSFSKYLTKVRLKNAQDLLIRTDLGMNEIAQLVGISDAAYFNRVFKKEYSISPNKYRQMNARR